METKRFNPDDLAAGMPIVNNEQAAPVADTTSTVSEETATKVEKETKNKRAIASVAAGLGGAAVAAGAVYGADYLLNQDGDDETEPGPEPGPESVVEVPHADAPAQQPVSPVEPIVDPVELSVESDQPIVEAVNEDINGDGVDDVTLARIEGVVPVELAVGVNDEGESVLAVNMGDSVIVGRDVDGDGQIDVLGLDQDGDGEADLQLVQNDNGEFVALAGEVVPVNEALLAEGEEELIGVDTIDDDQIDDDQIDDDQIDELVAEEEITTFEEVQTDEWDEEAYAQSDVDEFVDEEEDYEDLAYADESDFVDDMDVIDDLEV